MCSLRSELPPPTAFTGPALGQGLQEAEELPAVRPSSSALAAHDTRAPNRELRRREKWVDFLKEEVYLEHRRVDDLGHHED